MNSQYICYKCDKEFNKKYNLEQHLQRKNPCNVKKNYCCEICLYDFKNKQNLERHKNKKKNPCTFNSAIIKLEDEVKLLKIQNQNIVNNNTNTNINSHNTTNTTNNSIINNNIIIAQEEFKNHILNNCYSLKDIHLLIDNDNVKEKFNYISLDENHDDDDVLQNTNHISMILELIFCNVDLLENFIFYKDFIKNKIYYKINDNSLKSLAPADVIYIIAEVFKELLNYNDLDIELKKFYKKYIKKHNEQEFMELDTKELKNFVRKIIDNLDGSLAKLNKNIKLKCNGKFDKLHDIKMKEREKLIENKTKRHNKLLEDDNKNPVIDINKILIICQNLFKDDNTLDDEYTFKIYDKTFDYFDIKYIKLIGYFINKYYILNNISKIKYENNIFYSYYNTKWNKIQLIDIYDNFIEKMLEELYKYKFLIINETIKKVNDIDLDNDYYEFKEQLNDRPYKYILKYMVVNQISEINFNKKNIINSLISI